MFGTVDIAVIGGGASGLVAAITAKRQDKTKRVCIFEGLDRVGKKLITTGNGRCNITNKEISLARFHGERVGFAEYALNKYSGQPLEEFFLSVGIPFVNEGNKVFPASLQASSVVDCLRFECEKLGIEVLCGKKIEKIIGGKVFTLITGSERFSAKTVICCGGLYSGGDKVGSDGSLYRILKDMSYKTVKLSPSIVQLKTETDFTKQLKGIKVDAKATLFKNGKPIKSEFGEVLFCDYGLSGPAIMNISREAAREDRGFTVSLDLFPVVSKEALAEVLKKRTTVLKERNLEEFFTGMLNKRLGQVALKYCGYRLSDPSDSLSDKDFEKIALALKSFEFKVTGNTGFINSQATAGGISTSEFSDKTLMSKKHHGLFACGEILDIDGDCGGFNLTWAFASGILAAKSAINFLGEFK